MRRRDVPDGTTQLHRVRPRDVPDRAGPRRPGMLRPVRRGQVIDWLGARRGGQLHAVPRRLVPDRLRPDGGRGLRAVRRRQAPDGAGEAGGGRLLLCGPGTFQTGAGMPCPGACLPGQLLAVRAGQVPAGVRAPRRAELQPVWPRAGGLRGGRPGQLHAVRGGQVPDGVGPVAGGQLHPVPGGGVRATARHAAGACTGWALGWSRGPIAPSASAG